MKVLHARPTLKITVLSFQLVFIHTWLCGLTTVFCGHSIVFPLLRLFLLWYSQIKPKWSPRVWYLWRLSSLKAICKSNWWNKTRSYHTIFILEYKLLNPNRHPIALFATHIITRLVPLTNSTPDEIDFLLPYRKQERFNCPLFWSCELAGKLPHFKT